MSFVIACPVSYVSVKKLSEIVPEKIVFFWWIPYKI